MKNGTIFRDKETGSIGIITEKGSCAGLWVTKLVDGSFVDEKDMSKFDGLEKLQDRYSYEKELHGIAERGKKVKNIDITDDSIKYFVITSDVPKYAHWTEDEVDIIGNIFDMPDIKELAK